jgi:lysophospholipase L1-like esterase
MTGMTRRTLLGGVFTSIAVPAMAGRDDDPRPLSGPKSGHTRQPYRALRRWPVPPDNVPNHAYAEANKLLLAGPASARRVVMMGDSLTYNWDRYARPFFRQHGLVDRGIGGETSAQMLLRFGDDVVALKPQVVHIMAGTNDLAALRRPYDGELTRRNIEAMTTQARDAGIRVIMASVPPATGFRWGPAAGHAMKALNGWIHDLCDRNGYTYCDYWPVLRGTGDWLKPQYSRDKVHPNPAAYAVMGPVLLAAIDAALKSPSRNATR